MTMLPSVLDSLLVVCFCHASLASVSHKEKDFLSNLTYHYDPKIRPVLDGSNTTVEISAALESILSLDEKEEVISFRASVVMVWVDQLLTWEVTDDIPPALILPVSDVWLPTVTIVDSVTSMRYLKSEADSVVVFNDGVTLYSYVGRFDTSCKVNIQTFPFDVQTCSIHLSTLYSSVSKEILEVANESLNLEVYKENGEFHLLGASMKSEEMVTYGTVQTRIVITLTLKRRTTFYILNNILPVVFLSFLNIFVFLLPEESGEKMSLCVSILLSYAMFLTLINSYLPANSDHVCFFSVYVTLLVLISTLICLVTIFMLVLHTYFQKGKACPRWLPVPWRSDSKVGTSESWVKNDDIAPNQSDVKDKATDKSEMKDLIIAKCNRVALGTFFTLTLLINVTFFISVSP